MMTAQPSGMEIDTQGYPAVPVLARIFVEDFDDPTEVRLDLPFTKSRGTIMSRLYERLTKQSRRRGIRHPLSKVTANRDERFYRRGVYDAYRALQDEMA